MIDRRRLLVAGAVAAGVAWVPHLPAASTIAPAGDPRWRLSPAEWRKRLSADRYAVLREGATELPGTSPLLREHRSGLFVCAGCGLPVFSSRTKFDSGTGWPSFWAPLAGTTATGRDATLGFERIEEHCRRCGGHLGHVFNDGPKPTGKRHCINGLALTFVPGKAA